MQPPIPTLGFAGAKRKAEQTVWTRLKHHLRTGGELSVGFPSKPAVEHSLLVWSLLLRFTPEEFKQEKMALKPPLSHTYHRDYNLSSHFFNLVTVSPEPGINLMIIPQSSFRQHSWTQPKIAAVETGFQTRGSYLCSDLSGTTAAQTHSQQHPTLLF